MMITRAIAEKAVVAYHRRMGTPVPAYAHQFSSQIDVLMDVLVSVEPLLRAAFMDDVLARMGK